MNLGIKSISTFIGSKDFSVSRSFYSELGWAEKIISTNLSYFSINNFGFYLQDYYVKDWIENTMVLMQVDDVSQCYETLLQMHLHTKYPGVKLMPVKKLEWGAECFLIDPAGVLIHFTQFYNRTPK